MVHLVPENDEREHERDECWCDPEVRWQDPTTGEIYANGPMVVHRAADCREAVERLIGESIALNKRWLIFEC